MDSVKHKFITLFEKVSPQTLSVTFIILAITTAYLKLSGKLQSTSKTSSKANKKNAAATTTTTGSSGPLKDIFATLRNKRTGAAAGKKKSSPAVDRPFSSSYYYAHNNPGAGGGYKDGLRTEDYVMNKPRLLSRNGVNVDDDDDDITNPGDDNSSNNMPKTDDNEKNYKRTNSSATTVSQLPSSTTILPTSLIPTSSIPILKYGWEDTSDVARVRIDTIPPNNHRSTTTHNDNNNNNTPLSWDQAKITKSDILQSTLLGDDQRGLLVLFRSQMTGHTYHLHIPKMYGEGQAVSTIWKMKRLVVKIEKKIKGRSWPRLSAAQVVDVGAFKKELDED